MLHIKNFKCENQKKHCVIDEPWPTFSYVLEDKVEDKNKNISIDSKSSQIRITMNGWESNTSKQIAIPYEGEALSPFSTYEAFLQIENHHTEKGEERESILVETGRMGTPWYGQWITDGTYQFNEKKISPIPMTFLKNIQVKKSVKSAKIYATAMGIYELLLNGKKVGQDYFAPGFTSYKNQLQYQIYDVTEQITKENELLAVVGGGWAVGSFVFTRKNKITAKRQALLLELHLEYQDGSKDIIGTDESWQVTREGNYRYGDFYDGEIYDATIDFNRVSWEKAKFENLKIKPKYIVNYNTQVKAQERIDATYINTLNNQLIFDFNQNFAGIVELTINGKKGQIIEVKHAEILNPDGTLNTKFLRTAKASITYTCVEGKQTYTPRLTYMGFRYISISGISLEDVSVKGIALYSPLEEIGSFSCSNEMLNKLQNNIRWSAKSNFVDIPTDCPQRDERMGWTGDIAVFAQTACYNFEMSQFLKKWLSDLVYEQLPTGGIPNTIPAQGYGFPATMPTMAIDFWGDACVLVPWALYQSRGEIQILEKCYHSMKKYVEACKFWASFGFGEKKYIWDTLSTLHFGDWVAADVPLMSQWQKRSKWTATASLRNTSFLLAEIAKILGHEEDYKKYSNLSEKVATAYVNVFTNGKGKLLEEFQTAYVLPIYYQMFSKEEIKLAVKELVKLVKKSNYCIGTGFPGTPYILFALADHGYADEAYKMLLNTKCPSWLYEVKMGATTIWERWDGLNEEGICPIGDDGTDSMISYNHYASGAVGDFLYRRIVGIEAIEPGFKHFKIQPILGGDLTWAKGELESPYGTILSKWTLKNKEFTMEIKVPYGTTCDLYLPNGEKKVLEHGEYKETLFL